MAPVPARTHTPTQPRGRVRPRIVWAKRGVVALAIAAVAAAMTVGGSNAASSSVNVTLDVISSTNMDPSGCPVAARSFGTVLPDSSVVASGACTVVFGSSNNSSMLKLYQQDRSGDAMFAISDGTPDNTFDGDGKQTITFPGGSVAITGFQQTDGKLVVAGYSRPSSDADMTIARTDTAGVLDPSFGIGGRVVLPLAPDNDDAVDNAIQQPDGKLLFSGHMDLFFGLNLENAVVRLLADGTPDPAFGGGDGIVVWGIGGSERGYDIDLDSQGRIYVTGNTGPWNDGTLQDGFISRLRSDGTLDTTWGTGGTVMVDANPGASDALKHMTILADGKLLVVGERHNGSDWDLFTSRRLADGSVDTTYGTSGYVTVAPTAATEDSPGKAQVDQLTGEAFVTGYHGSLAGPLGWVRRLRADGSTDASWGNAGTVQFNFGAGRTGAIYGSYSPDMQTIFVVGPTQTGGVDKDWHVSKVSPSGTVTPYGPSGRFDFAGDMDYANTGFAGRDGEFYVVGSAVNAGAGDMGVMNFGGVTTIPDYGGAAVFGSANTQAAFGACLEARGGAGVTGGWGLDPGGACTAVVGDPWNGIADTPSDGTAKVLGSPTVGVTNASASIRFGVKTARDTMPRNYVARVMLEVVAPNA